MLLKQMYYLQRIKNMSNGPDEKAWFISAGAEVCIMLMVLWQSWGSLWPHYRNMKNMKYHYNCNIHNKQNRRIMLFAIHNLQHETQIDLRFNVCELSADQWFMNCINHEDVKCMM